MWQRTNLALLIVLIGNFSFPPSYAAEGNVTTSQAISTASGVSSNDCLFNWAEDQYPSLFKPSRPASETLGDYTLRRYTTSNTYLGISNVNDRLYYYAPSSTSNALLDLGLASTWKTQAACSSSSTTVASTSGSCRPTTYDSTTSTVLSGALKIEFEDISQAEGMLHVRFSNASDRTLFLSLDVSSADGRVGLMAPQAGLLYLSPGESLVGYVLYYSTGVSGPATYKTKFSFTGLDPTTGKSNSTSDSVERNVSFVRGNETALTVSDAATQFTYSRTSQVSANVGFWRYKVDQAEARIVLFPGQENWTDTTAVADAKVLAYSLDGTLQWEYKTGAETWGGDMTADGKYVAFATNALNNGTSSKLVLLHGTTGSVIKELSLASSSLPTPANAVPPTVAELDAREVRFSPDGSLLAVGTSEGRGYVFDALTLTPKYAVQTEGQLRAIEFQGDYIYFGAGDGLLYKAKLSDGSTVWRAYTTAWPYSEPAFSPDGKRVVVGAKSGGFTVLESETGSCVYSANYGTVRRAFFTPDGQYVVAATGAMSAGTIGYRVSDWQVAWRGPMSAAASVTSDSRYVLSADGAGTVMDAVTGQRVATLEPGFSSKANYFKTAYISKDGSKAVIARRDLTPGDVAIAFFSRK